MTNYIRFDWAMKRLLRNKFDYDGCGFVLNKAQGLKASELKKIKAVIDENTDIIMARWNEYFNR